jgi:hypothetical protein
VCKGTTCASFNLSGKTENLFTKFDMGFETAGFDNFKILDNVPSFPVAFLMPILFICFSTNSVFCFVVDYCFYTGMVIIYIYIFRANVLGNIYEKVVKSFRNVSLDIYNFIIFT